MKNKKLLGLIFALGLCCNSLNLNTYAMNDKPLPSQTKVSSDDDSEPIMKELGQKLRKVLQNVYMGIGDSLPSRKCYPYRVEFRDPQGGINSCYGETTWSKISKSGVTNALIDVLDTAIEYMSEGNDVFLPLEKEFVRLSEEEESLIKNWRGNGNKKTYKKKYEKTYKSNLKQIVEPLVPFFYEDFKNLYNSQKSPLEELYEGKVLKLVEKEDENTAKKQSILENYIMKLVEKEDENTAKKQSLLESCILNLVEKKDENMAKKQSLLESYINETLL